MKLPEMQDQGTKQESTALGAIPVPDSNYPSLELKGVAGFEGKKPGDECTLVIKGKLTSVQMGSDYGPDKGKNVSKYRFDVLSAGHLPYKEGKKTHDDYAKEGYEGRRSRAEEIIEESKERE